jgi:hypothetical protein
VNSGVVVPEHPLARIEREALPVRQFSAKRNVMSASSSTIPVPIRNSTHARTRPEDECGDPKSATALTNGCSGPCV